MSLRVRVLFAVALFAAISAPAGATAGFAEWEVYTPGGHRISHNDIWKTEHGTCLRSDTRADSGAAVVYVSWIERWRYYPGRIAGQDRDGWFLFDERTRKIRRFDSDLALQLALLGKRPESDWLTGADGWREAWFPFMVWRPCRHLLGLEPAVDDEAAEMQRAAASMFTEAECRAALDPAALAAYRRTTWGRVCAEWAAKGLAAQPGQEHLAAFCEAIRSAKP